MDKDEIDNVLSQILPDNITIKVESFYEGYHGLNLLIPNGLGWKSSTKDKTWVQFDFKSPKKIKIVGIKSNSFSEEGDPVEIEIIGKSEGEWFYFAKVKNLNFEARNMWKNINLIFYGKMIDVIKIKIIKNLSFLKKGKWEEGVHLGEIIFFE